MEFFKLFMLGFAGYLLSGFHDVAVLHHKSSLKRLFSLGFFLTGAPYLFLFANYPSPHQPVLLWTLIIAITLGVLLLIYSVFIETSLFSNKSGTLYTRGTYSFSRHPGFIWYTIVNFLLAIFFWDIRITLLCLGYIVCNLVLVIIEDTLLFPKMFLGYEDYKRKTPFFISFKNLLAWRRNR